MCIYRISETHPLTRHFSGLRYWRSLQKILKIRSEKHTWERTNGILSVWRGTLFSCPHFFQQDLNLNLDNLLLQHREYGFGYLYRFQRLSEHRSRDNFRRWSLSFTIHSSYFLRWSVPVSRTSRSNSSVRKTAIFLPFCSRYIRYGGGCFNNFRLQFNLCLLAGGKNLPEVHLLCFLRLETLKLSDYVWKSKVSVPFLPFAFDPDFSKTPFRPPGFELPGFEHNL